MKESNHAPTQILLTIITVFFTWELHEVSHWLMGEILGNKMAMTLNTGYPISGQYREAWHAAVVDIAAPLVTLIQAIVSYMLIKKYSLTFLFPSLLTCLYMRAMAGALTPINPNDEARVGEYLGLGPWVLPIIMIGILLYLSYDISKRKGITKRTIIITLLTIMVGSSIIILSDQALKIRLL